MFHQGYTRNVHTLLSLHMEDVSVGTVFALDQTGKHVFCKEDSVPH